MLKAIIITSSNLIRNVLRNTFSCLLFLKIIIIMLNEIKEHLIEILTKPKEKNWSRIHLRTHQCWISDNALFKCVFYLYVQFFIFQVQVNIFYLVTPILHFLTC